MSDKVIAYKPFFFKAIDTTKSAFGVSDQIFNLDNYHKIVRNVNSIYAQVHKDKGSKTDYIAYCNNEDGARWVMDCIMRRQTTTEEQVISVEQNGYDDTPVIL